VPGFLAFAALRDARSVDDVLFLSGNSGAIFVICFHFLDDSVYYLVAAQTRIGLGIALGLGRKKLPTVAGAIFAPRLAAELKAFAAFLERKI